MIAVIITITRVFHIAMKSDHYLSLEKEQEQTDASQPNGRCRKKGAGRFPEPREETAEPRTAHHQHPPPARPGVLLDREVSAGQPGRAPLRKVTDNRKVSAGQLGRWASRGGIRTGARVSPTKGDNL